ncbi:MAG: transglycosylase domain-containing protein [Vicinamibacterales bacterium]
MNAWLRRACVVTYLGLVALSVVAVVWTMRYSYAIYKLTRGVGDTVFYDGAGRPWFRMDEDRRDVPLSAISPQLRSAVVAIEDHRFYRHLGVDPIALTRATVHNLREVDLDEGGSTITQQLARTLFLSNRRTAGRKIQEAGIALLLELQLSKSQILELYLNRVYLSAGRYGVEPMSRILFGKPARDVTLAEAALIAGLIRAPSALSPWSNLDGAVRRSHVVLARMRELGAITAAQESRARQARFRIKPFPLAEESRHGYAKDYLRQQFRNRFGGDHPPEWKVHTTFLPELQEAAERAVSNGVKRVGRGRPSTRSGRPEPVEGRLQAALVAMDPRTGDIVAMVGGRDYRTSTFNRATRSRRQPGSAFKPFLYAAALERGYSPVSVVTGLADVEPGFDSVQGRPEEWRPRNANGDIPDELTLREALIQSNNRAAAALQQRLGSRPVLLLATSVGLKDLPDVPSLSLGSGEVTPLELTTAFAAFANGGEAVRPRGLTRVVDADGVTVHESLPSRERVLARETAFQMLTMLRDVIDRGTGAGARALGVYFPAAGKTGTTNGYRDAWFVGFSSEIVAGVWVGFDQPATIAEGAYGSRLALPIWSEFMRRAARVKRPRDFEPPDTLHDEVLCRVSYRRPTDDCPVYVEYFKRGDEIPEETCDVHDISWDERARRAIEELFGRIGRVFRER